MARINLRPGDSGDLTVTFAGDTIQEAITFQNNGTLTVSTTGCSIYPFLNGVELNKVVHGQPARTFAVLRNQTYDVNVVGTTDAQPSGVVHYSFA